MPSVNIYTNRERVKPLLDILPELRKFIAEILSCGNRKLVDNEISLRIIVTDGSLKIADTELEINAFSYPERVQSQDDICIAIRDYVQKNCPKSGSTYIWLQLSELGHSSKE